MPYYHDADAVSLDDLRIRIKDTDLVPSRSLLLENIEEKFAALNQCGINSLADLRQAVKTLKAAACWRKEAVLILPI